MNLPKSVAIKLTAGLLSAAMMISPALAASGTPTPMRHGRFPAVVVCHLPPPPLPLAHC